MNAPTVARSKSHGQLARCLVFALLTWGCGARERALLPTAPGADTGSARAGSTGPATGDAKVVAYVVRSFDVPATLGDFTSAFGIDDVGVITGNFAAADGSAHGFVFRDGGFTDVVVPGAGPGDRGGLGDVDNRGNAIGTWSDANDVGHRYLRDRTGATHPLPDALPGALATDATGLNDLGWISGTVIDASGHTHGFVDRGGTVTIVDHPGAARTRLFGIDNGGEVAGFYVDGQAVRHGFVLEPDGSYRAVDVPGALGTGATAINDRGQVVGFYTDTAGVTHGFLLDHGQFTTIDFPGSPDTRLTAINNRGVIVGTYDFFSRGLVAEPGAAVSTGPAGGELALRGPLAR